MNRLSFCVLAFALFCAGCAGGPAQTASGNGAAVAGIDLKEYALGAGDRVKISVFGEPDLTGEFVVGPNGTMSFPLVGEVGAGGKTVGEFNQLLGDELKRFIRQPSVSVEIVRYRPFYILGEVQSPGTLPYSVGLTVMNAVATAGGFTDRASSRHVYIRHANQESEKLYPLTSVTPVQPGDTVRVPERRLY